MTDTNDVVIAIGASLYASRATDDALGAEPPIESIANEARDLYHKLERAVRSSPRQHGDGGDLQIGRT
jgi:prefoldin subunit 5